MITRKITLDVGETDKKVRTYSGNLETDFCDGMIDLEHDKSFYDFMERKVRTEWRTNPPHGSNTTRPEHFLDKLMTVGVTRIGAEGAFTAYGVYVIDFLFETPHMSWQRMVRDWKVEKIRLNQQGIEEELHRVVHI
jgi:hypothetical protein